MRPLALALILTACSADDGEDTDGPLTELAGIYEIDTWTDNDAGCDAEGDSIADQQSPYLFLNEGSFFGQRFLQAVSCADLETCRTDGADDETVWLSALGTFDEGDDASGWTGMASIATENTDGDACEGRVTYYTLTSPSSGTLRLESEGVTVEFPQDSEGECPSETAEAEAEGQACTRLEVITATFVEALQAPAEE